jgi:hypothetical protein
MIVAVVVAAGTVAADDSYRPAVAGLETKGVTFVVDAVQSPAGVVRMLRASRAGQPDQVIHTERELAATVQRVRTLAGAHALASLALLTTAVPFQCITISPSQVLVSEKVRTTMRNNAEVSNESPAGDFVLYRYLACIDDPRPDRLILSREEVSHDGSYHFSESRLIYRGRVLPRTR